MSQKKKRQKVARERAKPSPIRSRRIFMRVFLPLMALTLAGLAGWWAFGSPPKTPVSGAVARTETPSLTELLSMTPEQLAQVDIAVLNLRCAEGLVGSNGLNVVEIRKTLDGYATYVRQETLRHIYRFREKPGDFQDSEAYFRLMMMATVLQEDSGVRYNPDRITIPGDFEANAKFFAEAKDVFLHGLTGPPMMGTCASMPVLYVAVGRRLGYPLFLVSTKNHLFVRWEDSRTRLNMDATSRGFTSDPDHYYKTWPYKVSDEEIAAHGLLKSMTPREELACFMSLRGACLYDGMAHYTPGIEAHRHALNLAPHIRTYEINLGIAVERLQERQAKQFMYLMDKEQNPTLRPPPGLYRKPAKP
jgi:hypothetical protein